jgi:lysophospholipase L1-like esterase
MADDASATRARASAGSRLVRGTGLSLAVVLALWLAFELVCRVIDLPKLSKAELDPISESLKDSRVAPHPYLAYANRPGFVHEPTAKDPSSVHHNSLGFRGRETTWAKPPGTYRILCLGGSSTYGIGPTSDETNWPVRLEAHLNEARPAKRVEVINGGCQGYSTFEMALNLDLRGIDFQPDLVLCYEAINDMRCALYPNVQRDNTHWRAVWPVERKSPLEATLEKSYAYLAWRRYATDWWSDATTLGRYVIVDFGKYMPDDYAHSTDFELGFASIRRNLVTIIGTAHAHGAEVLLVTQATRMGDFERFGSSDLQKRCFERVTRLMGEVANERSVPYCDARSVLEGEADRQRAAEGRDRIFVRPDQRNGEVHLTDEGCELLGRTLAARIVELRLIK